MMHSTQGKERQTPNVRISALSNSESHCSLVPRRIWGLYPQVQSTFSRLLQGKGRVNTLVKPVPNDEEQLSTFSIYEEKPLVVVVQQNAHSGRTLSHMNITHNATVEKCVSLWLRAMHVPRGLPLSQCTGLHSRAGADAKSISWAVCDCGFPVMLATGRQLFTQH